MKLKKILSAVLVSSMALSALPVIYAEDAGYDLKIEAESFTNTNWRNSGGALATSDAKYSGGKYISLYSSMNNVTEYYCEYDVETEEAGTYKLDTVSAPFNAGWTSEVFVSVNGGEKMSLNGSKTGTVDGDTKGIAKYSVGSINLNKGNNTVRFSVTAPRRQDSNACVFFDCFILTKSEFTIRNVTSDAPMQAFQTGEELKFNIVGSGEAFKDVDVVYDVLDYRGKYIDGGNVVIKAGNASASIVLSPKKKGAYQLLAKCKGNEFVQQFVVLTNLKDRVKHEDTPFALDAMPYGTRLNKGADIAEEYCKLLELSGVSWIRDRVYFTKYTTKTGDSYTFNPPHTKPTGDSLSEKGVKVSMVVNDYTPVLSVSDDYGQTMPTNLIEVYKFYKAAAEQFDGAVDCWEMWNESDVGGGGMYDRDPADVYAQIFKAAAIGIMDSDTVNEVYASPQGAAGRPDNISECVQAMFDNQIYEFTDIANYHFHRGAANQRYAYYPNTGTWVSAEYKKLQEKYGYRVANWNGETGISIDVPKERDADAEEQMIQAKYLVTSFAEDIAAGADKRFFFVGSTYNEGASSWGMTNRNAESAYAAYASLSAMTHILGKGDYIGKLKDTPDGVLAYAFADGDDTAIVYYSTSQDFKEYDFKLNTGKTNIRHFDIFANEKALSSSNGVYKLKAKDTPEYVKFNGKLSKDMFTDDTVYEIVEISEKQKTVDSAKRVICFPEYENAARNGAQFGGYSLKKDVNGVDIVVYNLNNHAVKGNVVAKSRAGWEIKSESTEVEIAPMSSQKVHFDVYPNGFLAERDRLVFYADLDCGKTTDTVSIVNSKRLVDAQPQIIDGQSNISLIMENPTDADKIVKTAKIEVNGKSATSDNAVTVTSKSRTTVNIPAEFKANDKNLDIKAEVTFTDGTGCNFEGKTAFAMADKKIDLTKEAAFRLPDDGEVLNQYQYGDDDFSGDFYLGADEENFYFTAVIKDNTHSASYTGYDIWKNDGIQFSIGDGLPAMGIPYYELGMSLTDEGETVVWCWKDPDKGGWNGAFEGTDCTITRDDKTHTTTYELVIPWKIIPQVSYDKGFAAFSMLVNENDGADREGYTEWGSGIGKKKETDKFRTILFSK